jgi:hypothetical protein
MFHTFVFVIAHNLKRPTPQNNWISYMVSIQQIDLKFEVQTPGDQITVNYHTQSHATIMTLSTLPFTCNFVLQLHMTQLETPNLMEFP